MSQQPVTMQDLETMKQSVDKGKELLGKAEGRLESLQQQESELNLQIKQQGIEPENLPDEIQKIQEQIQTLFSEAQALIPYELINR